ncbi:hypothetical protein [Sinorhizobium psoraleae]|uniref:hypothetical protein n=1 Tax=Sinorhizobium psoraleae TaxID=520838 RepID=UPI001568376A|nr:hypothetical protein [Sinorhizobium psoraleae]
MSEKSKRHPDDYTALSNWMAHDEVRDSEITGLVLRLADHGMRVAEIENLMKLALREQLELVEMFGPNEEESCRGTCACDPPPAVPTASGPAGV